MALTDEEVWLKLYAANISSMVHCTSYESAVNASTRVANEGLAAFKGKFPKASHPDDSMWYAAAELWEIRAMKAEEQLVQQTAASAALVQSLEGSAATLTAQACVLTTRVQQLEAELKAKLEPVTVKQPEASINSKRPIVKVGDRVRITKWYGSLPEHECSPATVLKLLNGGPNSVIYWKDGDTRPIATIDRVGDPKRWKDIPAEYTHGATLACGCDEWEILPPQEVKATEPVQTNHTPEIKTGDRIHITQWCKNPIDATAIVGAVYGTYKHQSAHIRWENNDPPYEGCGGYLSFTQDRWEVLPAVVEPPVPPEIKPVVTEEAVISEVKQEEGGILGVIGLGLATLLGAGLSAIGDANSQARVAADLSATETTETVGETEGVAQ
jgi:co-chaperonin GroES (HSP10)